MSFYGNKILIKHSINDYIDRVFLYWPKPNIDYFVEIHDIIKHIKIMATIEFEEKLWASDDKLRNNMDVAQ